MKHPWLDAFGQMNTQCHTPVRVAVCSSAAVSITHKEALAEVCLGCEGVGGWGGIVKGG